MAFIILLPAEWALPIRVILVDYASPLWSMIDRKVIALLQRLGLPDCSFTRYNYRGFELDVRHAVHDEMGDVFILVTPGRNWLFLGSPESVTEMFRHQKDFPRYVELMRVLNTFGPNVVTSEEKQWQNHRKITASCFTEQNNRIVWEEPISLAQDMLQYWTTRPSVKNTADDARTFSLHVLSRAGFGKSFPFVGHEDRTIEDVSSNYKESLQEILENIIMMLILGPKLLASSWAPRKWRRLHQASIALQNYMTKVYEEEKRAADLVQLRDRNLMTLFVRASQDEGKRGGGLTESEIYGNTFIFNYVGHDTTAHSFTFIILYLAANPQVQDWIVEELHHVPGDRPPRDWNLGADFPRLKRCLAAMYKTVRLHTPAMSTKWTKNETQQLKVNDKTVVVPPSTMVVLSYATLHMDPKYWGKASLDWRPSRWITGSSPLSSFDGEKFIDYRPGTFFWMVRGGARLSGEEVLAGRVRGSARDIAPGVAGRAGKAA